MIKYPTYKEDSNPTPLSELVICDKCERARWTFPCDIVGYCTCTVKKANGYKSTSMRKATASEKQEAIDSLETDNA